MGYLRNALHSSVTLLTLSCSYQEEIRPSSTESFVRRSMARFDYENGRGYDQSYGMDCTSRFICPVSYNPIYPGLYCTRASTAAYRGSEIGRGDFQWRPSS
ncbi:hypothetical protein D5086_002737 [Populus alba]|uniref:Uncharacterized protein n=1 Tax=Populus alba TaxID=43335 RepID=A0ACC4D2D0_POPAL